MSDLKKMLGKILYSTFTAKEFKALPPAVQRNIDPNDLNTGGYTNADGPDTFQEGEELNQEESEPSEFEKFFEGDRIPSIEETEKFLIEMALKQFEIGRASCRERVS